MMMKRKSSLNSNTSARTRSHATNLEVHKADPPTGWYRRKVRGSPWNFVISVRPDSAISSDDPRKVRK